ncbi:MAG: molybdopterin cofactor-binding domain-containing protein, partial [Opitutales bacterium]
LPLRDVSAHPQSNPKRLNQTRLMKITTCSRRDFLKATGLSTTGLIVGFRLLSSSAAANPMSVAAPGAFTPNAFIAISETNGITLAISCPEIGQNIRTTFAMILGEELGADIEKVRLHQAEPRGDMGRQTAGGSGSVRHCFQELREAAATARDMLIAAAAKEWGVSPDQCRTDASFVLGPDSKKVAFEAIAEKANQEAVPSNPILKPSSEFKYIGKATRCLDTKDIVTGKAKFGIDAMPENTAFAVMLRCPVTGGTLKSYDDSAAKQMPGVKDILKIDDKIAVIAANTWAAINASRAVKVDWDGGNNGKMSSEQKLEESRQSVRGDAKTELEKGDFEASFSSAPLKIDEEFFVPLLAHATLEPPNGTTWFHDGGVEIWGSCQTLNNLYKDRIVKRAADLPNMTGLPHEKITYHQMRIGGGFGRKLANDYVEESIQIAKLVDYPVKMIFTREHDIQNDRYRLSDYYRYRVGLEANGFPAALEERSCKPLNRKRVKQPSEVMRYFSNYARKHKPVSADIAGGALRAPGHNITSFVEQSLFDMMAEKAGIDPIEYHLALHGDPAAVSKLGWPKAPRSEAIICDLLKTVQKMSGWKQDTNYGYGLATFSGYGSHCALVALVPKQGGQRPVEKVFAAVHCGQVINPLGAKAQIEGGIIDCLSATLYQEVTVKDGRVQQSNFHDYKLLRMPEHPDVEISIADSTDAPQGLGEVSYPPMAAATTNALFDARGKRFTQLPIRS